MAMRRSRAEWEKIVAELEASGERHVAFCERRGLSVHAFRDWLHRFRQERSADGGVRSAKKSVQMVPVRGAGARRPHPLATSARASPCHEPFDLGDTQVTELETRIADAHGGAIEAAAGAPSGGYFQLMIID
jgi:hypothetical protein